MNKTAGTNMTRTHRTRLVRALEVRDHALQIINKQGNPPLVKLTDTNVGTISINYRGPSQKLPVVSAQLVAAAAFHGITDSNNLPYGLDIWTAQGKVMNLEWNESNETQLVSFKSGEWEAELERISAALIDGGTAP
jgi:hypothetical protein